jgi:hypothetical protein
MQKGENVTRITCVSEISQTVEHSSTRFQLNDSPVVAVLKSCGNTLCHDVGCYVFKVSVTTVRIFKP